MNKTQHGSALIFSLIVLLVMTLIGITAMNTSTLEEKMASNDRNQKIAFQSAESAIIQAETDIAALTWFGGLHDNFINNTPGYYDTTDALDVYDQNVYDQAANCVEVTPVNDPVDPVVQRDRSPCFTVKNLGTQAPLMTQAYGNANFPTQVSRITARGTDITGTATVLLQSHYRKELTP